MRLARAVPLILGVSLLAGLLADCGSSGSSDNGVASKSARAILAASRAAAQKASSVTIRSKSAQGPVVLGDFELKLTKDGGQGNATLFESSFQVVRTGETIYLKGDPALYEQLRVTGHVPKGAWLKAPATARFTLVKAFTEIAWQTSNLTSTSGKLTKGATATIEGQPTIELKIDGKFYKGRMFIKTTGKPYPVRFEKSGEETGRTTFSDWDGPASLTPPAKAIDVSAKLPRQGG